MQVIVKYRGVPTNPVTAAFLSSLLVLGASSTTRAALTQQPQRPPWRLVYSVAPSSPINCPDEKIVRTIVATNAGKQDLFMDDAVRSIVVEIKPVSGQVEAAITAHDENGIVTTNRKLTMPKWRCDLLANRIAFALRNIVDPLESPPTDAEPEPNASPAATPPIEEQTANESAQPPAPTITLPNPTPTTVTAGKTALVPPRSSRIPKLALSASIGGGWWNAPETALSTTIGIEAQWKRFTVGFEGRYDYAWSMPDRYDHRAERTGATLMACILQPFSRNYFMRGCAIGEFAQVFLQILGPNATNTLPPRVMVDVGAGIGIGVWLVPQFGMELRAEGAYVIRRPLVFDQDDQVWRAAPFTGALRVAFVGLFDVFGGK